MTHKLGHMTQKPGHMTEARSHDKGARSHDTAIDKSDVPNDISQQIFMLLKNQETPLSTQPPYPSNFPEPPPHIVTSRDQFRSLVHVKCNSNCCNMLF